jgi:GGDEF domain-containing protein
MIPAGAALETTAEAAPKAPHEESWEAPSIHDLVDHLPEPEPELEPEPESPPVPLVALEPAAEPRIEEPAEAEPIEEPAAALVSALPAPEPELPATPPLAVADLLDPDPLPQALAVPAPPPEAAKLPGPAETLPAGYHDRGVLTSLMQRSELINGVVVAIGINEYQHNLETMGRQAMQDLMRSVEEMVQSLLGGADFACRSNDDEFILFFPGETGAAAQRRLTTISERLWNFQLRSITSFSVLFSWGAVETQGETLADAVASASERMYQTKRNRRASEQRRKLAVNL